MKFKKKPDYRVRRRRVVFSKGPIHLVDCWVEMPEGHLASRQVLEHPGAVVIIPHLGKDRYVLIRQFRFAARDWLWEFPAGGLEPGESVREAARRELIEEIGHAPGRLKRLVHFYPTPGISGEIMYLFLADKLKPAKGKPDEDERIEAHEFSLPEIGKMIRQGKIVDAKTTLGYFYLKMRL